MSVPRIGTRSQFDTQETQETGSYDYSDADSVARFPAFHFSLHRVTALSALPRQHDQAQLRASPLKVTVLVAVLEVDGPDTVRVKKGADAGKDVSILKMILGDEDGSVCKLTAWREVAESWGGSYSDSAAPAVKRGDVVLLESTFCPSLLAAFWYHSPRMREPDNRCAGRHRRLKSFPQIAHSFPQLKITDGDLLSDDAQGVGRCSVPT